MVKLIILGVFALVLSLVLYSYYIEDRRQRREKKAIKEALKDAGYV